MEVKKEKFVTLEGIVADSMYGRQTNFTSFVQVIDLFECFSLSSMPRGMESVFREINSRLNSSRLEDTVALIKKGINNFEITPTITLTFAISGSIELQKGPKAIAKLRYSPENTLIIDGVLTFFALIKLMGFDQPFIKKAISKKSIEENSSLRQKLATLSVQVNLLFDSNGKRSYNELTEVYEAYSCREDKIHAPLSNAQNKPNTLYDYISLIVDELNIDRYGGMSRLSKRIKKSDPYITTEFTLSRLVLGAIGGKEAQNKCSSSDFGKPESRLSLDRAEFYRKPIVAFLKEWLLSIDNQISNRDSLIYSAQTWQALGLVIHDLVESKVPEHRLTQAAKIIGELSYEKDSKHWDNCDVMELDLSHNYYKSSVKGGREFRLGLSVYMLSILI
ncbi:hypothetical protein MW329_002322 [Vibrio vulnificus]|nr:hypothetical protein [Vibrio vulnificus]